MMPFVLVFTRTTWSQGNVIGHGTSVMYWQCQSGQRAQNPWQLGNMLILYCVVITAMLKIF